MCCCHVRCYRASHFIRMFWHVWWYQNWWYLFSLQFARGALPMMWGSILLFTPFNLRVVLCQRESMTHNHVSVKSIPPHTAESRILRQGSMCGDSNWVSMFSLDKAIADLLWHSLTTTIHSEERGATTVWVEFNTACEGSVLLLHVSSVNKIFC